MAKSNQKLNTMLNLYTLTGVILMGFATVLLLSPLLPKLWYSVRPDSIKAEVASLTNSLTDDIDGFSTIRETYIQSRSAEVVKLPDITPTLGKQNAVRLPQIQVNSPIYGGANFDTALEKGTWIAEGFGRPDDQFAPIILAAHRWGGITWSTADRDAKSFYRLPSLKNGDTVEIIWDQRSYLYQIYSGGESTKIQDYNADLILYTCKLYWESPVRIFKYAKRIN